MTRVRHAGARGDRGGLLPEKYGRERGAVVLPGEQGDEEGVVAELRVRERWPGGGRPHPVRFRGGVGEGAARGEGVVSGVLGEKEGVGGERVE